MTSKNQMISLAFDVVRCFFVSEDQRVVTWILRSVSKIVSQRWLEVVEWMGWGLWLG